MPQGDGASTANSDPRRGVGAEQVTYVAQERWRATRERPATNGGSAASRVVHQGDRERCVPPQTGPATATPSVELLGTSSLSRRRRLSGRTSVGSAELGRATLSHVRAIGIRGALLAAVAAYAAGCGGSDEVARPVERISFDVLGPVKTSQRAFTLVYERGNCEPEWIGTRIRKTPGAVRVSALVHPFEGSCAGVGLDPPNRRQFRLPEPLGGRALIADQDRGAPALIVVPPRNRGDVRRLVTGGRLHPVFYEFTGACDAVAAEFKGVRRDEWCGAG